VLTLAKIAGKKLFNAFGLDIRKKRAGEVSRASMRGALRQLASLGFRPQTIIDAGVAYETSDLYREFPKSRILLVEPQAEFEPFLRKICETYEAEYVIAAAGAAPGTVVLNVHQELHSSSLLKEVEGTAVDGKPRQVPMVTLDQMCAERKLKGPYLIKLDVQGAELQVLEGSQRTLEETEALVVEVSLFASMIGGPQLHDIVARMKELGFVAYDMWGILHRPLDNALAQADMIFVKEHGRFRVSHAFATPEQRKALAWAPDPRLANPDLKQR
jgi:FkbM family methyltransferase